MKLVLNELGKVMSTSNLGSGGGTWSPHSSNTANRLTAVSCPPASSTCYAVGDYGTILKSSDSGSKALHLVGYSCPLGAIVDEHPEACLVAEALVARASGLRVSEHCERDDGHPPRCRFEVEPIDA